jgi:perosamine synthetase
MPLNQNIPFIPLAVPDLRGNEAAYLVQCIEDNWVSSAGPYVTELEQKVAALAGCKYGIATSSGTSALHLALVAAGVKAGDHVIVPDWTFAATANAVHMANAVPYFVDITEETWTLSPKLVAEALTESSARGIKVAAVIVVHTLGHPADMTALIEICTAAGVALIEDAAGAIGARYKGSPVGGLGDAAIFSFNGNKTVTAGGGGMIVTNNEIWAQRAKHLSTQARPTSDYIHDEIGFNYRLPNINAALGMAQIERLQEMIDAKRHIAKVYDHFFGNGDQLIPMPRAGWAESSYWLYSVLVNTEEGAISLVDHLDERGIGSRNFWRSLSKQKPYAASPSLLDGTAEGISGRVVSLPCSSSLTEVQQNAVITAIRNWRRAD